MIATTNPDEMEYISPAEASHIASLTTKTLTRMADAGTIRAKKLPSGHRRYLRSDVEALLTPSERAS